MRYNREEKSNKKGGSGVTHTERAYAKINLSLDVTAKRRDGYHELLSVMQTVSLCDTLTVTRVEKGYTLDTGGVLDAGESNLVTRAVRGYFAASQEPFGVAVKLEKRIPMQAGLGGGSADAAATLRALNALDGNRFTAQELCRIACAIGADVPFCVVGGTRVCRGIGEQMERVDCNVRAHVVVAMRGEGVSTPAAFAALDARYGDFAGTCDTAKVRLDAIRHAMREGTLETLVPLLYNRFEDVVEPIRPDVAALKRELLEKGALHAQMSGSGPAVFGLFEREEDARRAASYLVQNGATAFACELI